MALLDIRKWFIEASGRFDLVVDLSEHADNGADKYIKAGQRWLDRQAKFLNQQGQVYRTLAAGEFMLKLQYCRMLREVWAGISGSGLYPLTYITPKRMKLKFPKAYESASPGLPLYFAQYSLREFESLADQGEDEFRVTDEEPLLYDGILIMPPPDQEYHISLVGEFFTTELAADEDENFWTIHEPNLLVKAGLRELEAFYRNYQGVNDWTNSILQDLLGIEKDFVDNVYGHYDQMEG